MGISTQKLAHLEPEKTIKPILIFSYGNPSRGDDALGPVFADQFDRRIHSTALADQTDFLTDFQLQIEHAIDLQDRERVIFVDASVSCKKPFEFIEIHAEQDTSYTTHALHPAALLDVYQKINTQQPPSCFLLSIRGYEFDLGKEIGKLASENLNAAVSYLHDYLSIN